VPEVPAVSGTVDLVTRVEQVFADEGPLAGAVPEFEPRAGQREMAALAADVFERGGVLLAEAGTGTGKTLAYLVPAILSGHRALISTGTKNLQEQIYFKDIPMLQAALGRPFTATYMKGRSNYLCLHRYDAFRENPTLRSLHERVYLKVIDDWAQRTETGDRAEMDEVPDDLALWSDLSATAETCLGTGCPKYDDCFVTRMRRRAAESDVVIVNHHLLCADAAVRQSAYGEVIPDCSFAVVDEAHQLEDVATQYFGISLSNYRADELVRDGQRLAGGRLVADGETRAVLHDDLDRLNARAREFFAVLPFARPPAASDENRWRVTLETLRVARDPGQRLIEALQALEATIQLSKDASEDLLALGRRATTLRDDLQFLLRGDERDFVFYLETRGRGVFLRAAPIDVSAIVRQLLLDRMQGTVLTSATLSVDGSFEYVKRRLGVGRATELRLPSEFDFTRQAILYLPLRMPEPRSPAFADAAARETLEILTRTRGRAFVLFTSYATLRDVHARIRGALTYPILIQGEAPRSTLLRQFRSTPNAVLLATSSFWQGVDVVGEALSCVIVDKLPFASPSDPITSARIEAITSRGGDAFGEYQVPLAILTLLQGLGRLIRHRQDRGVLAILDPRLRTKGYGRRFLAALPPARIISRLDDITRFLADDDAR
jgi:ATP-dependent DNA helicase DinG